MSEDKITCRTPNPDKPGTTRIPAWKFHAIRKAILDILDADEVVAWSDLTAKVTTRLSAQDRENMGSVSWHTVSVKLEMEVRGEIARIPGKGPQRIRCAG